ncbi:MAG: type II secretion system protein GspN [SAR324 cluster bacterium]|nr:type II secretion system protein GspN [SAR324 cluster bacterium]
MRWGLRMLFGLIGTLGVALAGLIGLGVGFPERQLAETLARHLQAQTGIPVEISSVQLGWSRITLPEVAFRTPPAWSEAPSVRLLVLESLELSYWPLLVSWQAQLSLRSHGGEMQVSAKLDGSAVDLQMTGVELGRMPLSSVAPWGTVAGILSFAGNLVEPLLLQQTPPQIPQGDFSGSLRDVRIQFKAATLEQLGVTLPGLTLDEVGFKGTIGSNLTADVQFKGMLTGTLSGWMRLNPARPQNSLLNLRVQLNLNPELRQQLGSAALLLRGFQCGTTVSLKIEGTVAQPLTKKGECA